MSFLLNSGKDLNSSKYLANTIRNSVRPFGFFSLTYSAGDIAFFIGLLLLSSVYGQEKTLSSPRTIADSLLSINDFKSALPIFENLLLKYPRDPYYNYALGVCYLYTSRNLEKSIGLLKKASTADVPNLVYFYLAEAYRFSYRFNEAIDYYRRYTINGGSPKHKTEEVEKLVNVCENGSFLLKYLYQPPVIDKKMVELKEFYSYYNLENIPGILIPKPDDLKTSIDKKLNESSIILYPKNLKADEYIYYSSYGNSESYGKDIFRVQLKDDGFWSKPENLGDAINSASDEDYPFVDKSGTLYFASKGHYSMGGFDIFYVNLIGSPEVVNIGYPLNNTENNLFFQPTGKNTAVIHPL
ncbi:MAG: CDC27 family protein, partial [Candidatus Omnitrophica bacterium]|nr:CDC27 family protein [Candidatus Omnitrophota bacterium]